MSGTLILIAVMALVVVLGRYALAEGKKIETRKRHNKNKGK